jgi:hypothetical protein
MMGMETIAAAAISIQFAAFAPGHVDVVTGDALHWANDSARAHDVVQDGGGFDSGRLAAGAMFEHHFDAPGTYMYYCSIHPSMTGEIDVHDLLLDAPRERAATGKPYVLTGRAAAGLSGTVTIESDDGAGFRRAGDATIAPDGTFRATVTPRTTTTYRAVVNEATSPAVALSVLDHAVTVTARHRGAATTLRVAVAPAAPGQTVVLQLRLKDRFGWWPVARARLGARSTARFTLHRHASAPARVLLTLPDGATELARSRTVRVGPLPRG